MRRTNQFSRNNKFDAAKAHVKAYNQLEERLGPIVSDVKKLFFGLDKSSINVLLNKYETLYGFKAREYADNTFNAWMTGATKMSGQTAERLLNLVPEFIPVEKRHELVKKLCSKHQSSRYQSIEIDLLDPSPGVNSFYMSVEHFKTIELLKHLPDHVMSTLKWLNNDDITALRAILAEVDKHNAEQVAALSIKEFKHIKSIIDSNGNSNAKFNINFPTGTLTVNFKQPSLFRKIIKFFN